jgi:hypothetical protein
MGTLSTVPHLGQVPNRVNELEALSAALQGRGLALVPSADVISVAGTLALQPSEHQGGHEGCVGCQIHLMRHAGVLRLIVLQDPSGQRASLRINEETDTTQLADGLDALSRQRADLEIETGAIHLVASGVRRRLRHLEEVLLGDATAESESSERVDLGTHQLPVSQAPSRTENLASHNDSFGKIQWGQKMLDFAAPHLAESWEALPASDRTILIFPGYGAKEADRWREFFRLPKAFDGRGFVGIEREYSSVQSIREKYPEALIHRRDFLEKPRGRQRGDRLIRQVQFAYPDQRFSVINIDPENMLSAKFLETLQNLFRHLVLAPKAVVGVNFVGKRGRKKEQREIYEKITGMTEAEAGGKKQLRERAIAELIPYIFAGMKKDRKLAANAPQRRYEICATQTGRYLGKGTTPMQYAMHTVQWT